MTHWRQDKTVSTVLSFWKPSSITHLLTETQQLCLRWPDLVSNVPVLCNRFTCLTSNLSISSALTFSVLFQTRQTMNYVGQLAGQVFVQVKELYQGVQANLQSLQPGWSAALGRLQEGEAHQRLQMELEREVGRRRTLAQQTRALLESQLQVLRSGLQAQRKAQQGFTARLRESLRLLGWSRSTVPVWDQHSPQ